MQKFDFAKDLEPNPAVMWVAEKIALAVSFIIALVSTTMFKQWVERHEAPLSYVKWISIVYVSGVSVMSFVTWEWQGLWPDQWSMGWRITMLCILAITVGINALVRSDMRA